MLSIICCIVRMTGACFLINLYVWCIVSDIVSTEDYHQFWIYTNTCIHLNIVLVATAVSWFLDISSPFFWIKHLLLQEFQLCKLESPGLKDTPYQMSMHSGQWFMRKFFKYPFSSLLLGPKRGQSLDFHKLKFPCIP